MKRPALRRSFVVMDARRRRAASPTRRGLAQAGFVLFLVAALVSVTWLASSPERAPDGAGLVSRSEGSEGDRRVDYVGYRTDRLDATAGVDERLVEFAWEAWRRSHPDATVLEREPVRRDGVLIGYRITYEP